MSVNDELVLGDPLDTGSVLGDATTPYVLSFDPKNGDTQVAPYQTVVTLTFNEPIVLGHKARTRQYKFALVEMEKEKGLHDIHAHAVVSGEVVLSSPLVTVGDRYLRLDLSGLTRPNMQYSLTLPSGTVVDLAGNEFAGLVVWSYRFSTGSDLPLQPDSDSSSSLVGVVVALFLGIVLCVCMVAFFFFRNRRSLGQIAGQVLSLRSHGDEVSAIKPLPKEGCSCPSTTLGMPIEDGAAGSPDVLAGPRSAAVAAGELEDEGGAKSPAASPSGHALVVSDRRKMSWRTQSPTPAESVTALALPSGVAPGSQPHAPVSYELALREPEPKSYALACITTNSQITPARR
eukprot:gnl/TRDRNA2_/TRDRNA2_194613_c0_seq1.p1 gnl/TRDRNA2_/TRDRNA2_194613_c0~~gnl/TRDRNA2_/TRDRNA2_194613_c0_seq1.p1  ORF type:complete len:345 (+),score=40.25 gnl/TRDRNA2_/TRDRNA2_194613_c0_seq1:38-1072(+)